MRITPHSCCPLHMHNLANLLAPIFIFVCTLYTFPISTYVFTYVYVCAYVLCCIIILKVGMYNV